MRFWIAAAVLADVTVLQNVAFVMKGRAIYQVNGDATEC